MGNVEHTFWFVPPVFLSQGQARCILSIVLLAPTVYFGACYALWLSEGCILFMPFVSDLGIGSQFPMFVVGNLVEGLFLAVWFAHVLAARDSIIRRTCKSQVSLCTTFNIGSMFSQSAVALGVAFIGFFPWNVTGTTALHFACADGVFYGGCSSALASALVSLVLEHDSRAIQCHDAFPCLRQSQMPLAIICIIIFGATGFCFLAACASDPSFFGWHWWTSVQKLATDDFHAYCRGSGFHGFHWVNWTSTCEWLTLMVLFGSMLTTHADSEFYFAMTRGAYDLVGEPDALVRSDDERVGKELILHDRFVFLSRTGAHFVLGVGLASIAVSDVACYCLWFGQGCFAYMPFISDFGLQEPTRLIFSVGNRIGAIFLLMWFSHVVFVRAYFIRAIPFAERVPHRLVQLVSVIASVFFVLGLLLVGHFSWDQHFFLHMACLISIVAGGMVWNLTSLLFTWTFQDHAQLRVFKGNVLDVSSLQFCLACGHGALLLWFGSCFVSSCIWSSQFFKLGWWREAQIIPRTNFQKYCLGDGLHSISFMNTLAFIEWLIVNSVFLGITLSLSESEMYFDCHGYTMDLTSILHRLKQLSKAINRFRMFFNSAKACEGLQLEAQTTMPSKDLAPGCIVGRVRT